MLDEPEKIRKKIMGATTDSESRIHYDPENKPGVSNLMNIYSVLTGENVEQIEDKYVGKNYGEFKRDLADIVVSEITKIQEKYYKLIDSEELDKILENGAEKVRKIARDKFMLMKKNMGLYR